MSYPVQLKKEEGGKGKEGDKGKEGEKGKEGGKAREGEKKKKEGKKVLADGQAIGGRISKVVQEVLKRFPVYVVPKTKNMRLQP